MEDTEVTLSDIENLRSNKAWTFLTQEWEEILGELQSTLIGEDYPNIYRTQGRASALMHILANLDNLEEVVKNGT